MVSDKYRVDLSKSKVESLDISQVLWIKGGVELGGLRESCA